MGSNKRLISRCAGSARRAVYLIDTNVISEAWLGSVIEQFGDRSFLSTQTSLRSGGRLRVPDLDQALDKPIAAIALVNDLALATRNVAHFQGLGVRLKNPFALRGE